MKTTQQTNRIPLLVLGLSCLVLALWSWQLHREVNALQQENADLQPKLNAASQRIKTSEAEARKWRAQADSLLAELPGNSTAEEAGNTAKSDRKRNFHPEDVAALIKNPAMQSMIASQQKAFVDMTYRDLIERFKLSSEERDYLQKLLLDRQMVQVGLGMQMLNADLPPEERAALGQQIRHGIEADDAKIRDFLNNDEDYDYYQTYSRQEPVRMEVGMFESSLGGADALDVSTAESLANLMSDTQNSFPFTVNFYNHANFGNPAVLNSTAVNKFLDEQERYQAQVTEKAADLLSPAQLEALKQSQAAARQMTKLQLNSIIQMSGGGN